MRCAAECWLAEGAADGSSSAASLSIPQRPSACFADPAHLTQCRPLPVPRPRCSDSVQPDFPLFFVTVNSSDLRAVCKLRQHHRRHMGATCQPRSCRGCSNAGEKRSRPALRSWKAPAGLPLMSMRGHLGVTFAQGHASVATSGNFARARASQQHCVNLISRACLSA